MQGEVLSERYEIHECIGEGGMARVYKAWDRLLHRWVAVKVLREQYASDEQFVERFRREAQAAASLSHPNVVNIYDVGEIRGTYYIVMEYVRGISLKELIRRERVLSVDRAVDIVRQVAAALSHAHKNNLIHRDIKPHNILITEEGRVKVTDFGIARAASTATLTQTGLVIGSVHYFSPEQARGAGVSEQSDIYSLGVVLYELVTGRVPFTGESPIAVALQHLQEPVRPPSQINPNIPSALEEVIMRALAKRPKDRYASVDEFRAALKSARMEVAEDILPQNDREEWSQGLAAERTRVVPAAGLEEETRLHNLQGEEAVVERKRIKKEKRRKRRTGIYIFLFFLAFLAGLFWAASILPELIFPEEVSVPDITGKTTEEARRILEKKGLKFAVDKEIYSSEVAAGRVIRQDPEANRRVKVGRTVWSVVSRGPRLVQVPDVIGLQVRDARLRITQVGLKVRSETGVYEPDAPLNTVVNQSPQPGAFLEEGLAVDLMVNQGQAARPLVVLPDFRGQLLEEAKARLRELGLVIGNVWRDSNPALPPWVIISQNPAPGSRVPQGTSVDFVYNGPGAGSQEEHGEKAEAPGKQDNREPEANTNSAPLPSNEDHLGLGKEFETTGEKTSSNVPTASQGSETRWHEADVQVTVPPGPKQEITIIVIDRLGAREVYRGVHPGESTITRRVRGQGPDARIQVYMDNVMVLEEGFPDT